MTNQIGQVSGARAVGEKFSVAPTPPLTSEIPAAATAAYSSMRPPGPSNTASRCMRHWVVITIFILALVPIVFLSFWQPAHLVQLNQTSNGDELTRKKLLKPTTHVNLTAEEIVDRSCSFIPDSLKDLEFPLHMSQKLRTPTDEETLTADGLMELPLIWLFDSGVMLKTEHLTNKQIGRFWKPGTKNIWEVTDEPLIMKAVKEAYHTDVAKKSVSLSTVALPMGITHS